MNYQFHHIDSCPSTNKQLKESFLANKAQPGTVLVAKTQTHGRGRYNRTWVAPEGNLNISILINTENNAQSPFIYNLKGGLAVCKAINKVTPLQAKIKWPNDILIDNKKVCGILSEFIPEKKTAIIGIGINVNSRITDFPQELQPTLTTIYHETKNTIDLHDLVHTILNEYETIKHTTLISDVTKNLAWREENVCVQKQETKIDGKLVGLDDNGFLLIKRPDQRIETVMTGDLARR
jgi:BirA family transcriptional regulator, biotin operon repressor / biotin---[acetyl-CoA-carboxylase] ligase